MLKGRKEEVYAVIKGRCDLGEDKGDKRNPVIVRNIYFNVNICLLVDVREAR